MFCIVGEPRLCQWNWPGGDPNRLVTPALLFSVNYNPYNWVFAGHRCRPVHTEVPGCGSANRVLLPTEKVSVVCAEARTGGERGKWPCWFWLLWVATLLYNDTTVLKLTSIHPVVKEFPELYFKTVTYDQCLTICCSLVVNARLFSLHTFFFLLHRMFQSCVMSCRGKKCWSKSTCPNCTTGNRCWRKWAFSTANPLTSRLLARWPFWNRPRQTCPRRL